MMQKNTYYLRALGIDHWTLRQNTGSIFPACYAYQLWRHDQCIGFLFAAAIKEDPAIAELLIKIAAAIKCESQGGWYSTQPDYSEIKGLRFIITLGEGFEVDDSILHLHSHAPQRLIEQPQLKAETWKTLQVVLRIVQSTSS